MSRDDGFPRMDVSTSIADDPKFRLLGRRHPELIAAAYAAYVVGLLAMSWREGQRLTLEETWPALLPYDITVADALLDVKLVDDEYRIPFHAWDGWFAKALKRRHDAIERYARYNRKRPTSQPTKPTFQPTIHHPVVTASLPRGEGSEKTLRELVPEEALSWKRPA